MILCKQDYTRWAVKSVAQAVVASILLDRFSCDKP
jgi:hypothetical protein